MRYDYSNGSYFNTENPFDVAIGGPGFIPVTGKDGSVAYTRDGSFKTDAEGNLIDNDGYLSITV